VRNYGAAIEHYWFMGHFEGNEPIAEVLGFTTRNGAVRAAAFRAIGGFDTSYKTNAHEDYDFGKRLAAQFKTVMAQGPLVYHKFPDSLLRLLRNYWVRITLFVPYYIRNRPTLDKTQASPGEAIVRLVGGSVPLWILLAVLPIPGTAWWLGASAAALGAYAASIRGFLRKSAVWSGGWQFPFVAFWIHLLSSQIVTLGGAWGLVSYTLGGSAVAAKSPVK
jgi:GT2 family glycosyltransferase